MRVEGTYTFKADRETLWNALQSPEVLSSCIPGCERFEATGEDAFDVLLRVKVAAITGTYSGTMRLIDKVHPDSYRMLVEGRGVGGSVKGEGVLRFTETDGGTEVSLVGDAQVSGIVARVGQRLLGPTSKLLMNQFFRCMKESIEG